ncbi:hypothetical protein CNE_1c11920 [Cupriavidus necator N-1]|uniref:Phage protein n=1 Tax=Cupriavidus necator (strain ATCC 43291 / DSM 13513 / CCUG 52238 / LMG 8453 / N-1) TaxID=1042878 RepID=G0ER29_CUPNN|nr:hypothetical protein [Cupriavidus necator]AEI76547.1 hypothetical protein CNE_1c11920 [Cupriavidus necator N-1]MDX6011330.1 hypothetical protein [Cupriavidus necator]
MGFDTARFWPSFKRHGMLSAVSVAGSPDFDGRLDAPSGFFVDNMVQAGDVTLQYPADTPVTLSHGMTLQCKGRTYKVLSEEPERLQDGWLLQVKLKDITP